MNDRYADALERYRERLAGLDTRMADPAVLSSPAELRKAGKERSEVAEVLGCLEELARLSRGVEEAREIVAASRDAELVELARAELAGNEARPGSWRAGPTTFFSPGIRTTPRTSSSRSGPAPAARRRRSSPPSSSACTPATPRAAAGGSRS